MARPRQFDEAEALDRAVELFWRKGYAATSMRELVAATGLNRASLYATFGDKDALFRRALDRYRARATAETEAYLDAQASGRAALRGLFEQVTSACGTEQGRLGCFVANASAELAAHDPHVGQMLAAHEATFVALLSRTLARVRREAGEPIDGDELEARARTLYALLNGLRVVGRVPGDPQRMTGVVEAALRLA